MGVINNNFADILSFVEFLKYAKGEIGRLAHVKKTDHVFILADNWVRYIKRRFVQEYKYTWEGFDKSHEGRNLNLSSKILEHHSFRASDKRKSEIIKEFKDEYCYDLGQIIYRLEYVPEKPTNPTA